MDFFDSPLFWIVAIGWLLFSLLGARSRRRRAMQAPSEPADQSPARPAAQPRLSGLYPAERGSGALIDEDLLDIPAFLRRQAN